MRCARRPSARTSTTRTVRRVRPSSRGCSSNAVIWRVASTRCWPMRRPDVRTSRSTASSRCTTTRASILRWCRSSSNAHAEKKNRMRVLIIKTSSMGDVVHALPVVHDMHQAIPGVQIEWLVESAFAAIPRLHPGVQRVLPLAWRRWRRKLASADTWRAMRELRAQLRAQPYDLVLDLQGLLKSALWGRQALGPLAGYDAGSAREAMATWLYARKAKVSRSLHAIQRCRQLAAAHLGYALPAGPPVFGIAAAQGSWKLRG